MFFKHALGTDTKNNRKSIYEDISKTALHPGFPKMQALPFGSEEPGVYLEDD